MGKTNIQIRLLQSEDFADVVAIDEKVFKHARPEYYESKFTHALDEKEQKVISLVADVDGKVVGFVMCELFVGQCGIPADTATLDTIGIHPDFQQQGISRQLMEKFTGYLRKAGVEKVNTLVSWNNWKLIKFFSANGFEPAKTINLELNLK